MEIAQELTAVIARDSTVVDRLPVRASVQRSLASILNTVESDVNKSQSKRPVCAAFRHVTDPAAQRGIRANALLNTTPVQNTEHSVDMLAHEVNNILTPVVAYCQIAMTNPYNRGAVADALAASLNAARRISGIADAILASARRDAVDHSADLSECVEQACLTSVVGADWNNIRVTLDLPDRLNVRIADAAITQVITNLILNAGEAMRPGGGVLSISAHQREGEAVLIVRDTGRGIAREAIANVFTPLYSNRAPGSTSGSGFGLALCKRLVEHAGGTIEIQSRLDEGSTVTVTLPVASSTPAPRSAQYAPERTPRRAA